jgi:hypothetical protein
MTKVRIDDKTVDTELEVHPLAMIFPRLDEAKLAELTEDIEANGLQHPILLYEGKILDGVNRYEACKMLNKEVWTYPYSGRDPIGYVLSANLHRRHLSTEQRAFVAAKLSNLKVGDNQTTKGSGTSIEVAAKLVEVSRASVERALAILRIKDPVLIQAAQSGETSLAAGARQAQSQKPPAGRKRGGKGPKSTKLSDKVDKLLDKLVELLADMKPNARVLAAHDVVKRLIDEGYYDPDEDLGDEEEDEDEVDEAA